MQLDRTRRQAVDYILERACRSGGFCFYRLDEPNPQDTYYALAGLHLLGVPPPGEKTAAYLASLQDADGSFGPLSRTYFAVASLHLLGRRPLRDPGQAVAALLRQLLDASRPPRDFRAQTYRDLDRACALPAATGLPMPPPLADELAVTLQRCAHPGGGFGVNGPSLDETRAAVSALCRIGKPVAREDVAPFVRACEDATFGFTGKPGSSLSYLEYIHAGVSLCAALGMVPTHTSACADFILNCQTTNGGFARAETGIATLENTYFALQALMHLNHGEDRHGAVTPP
ncbi:MAG: prenyltransferase/squalene oxidase repeat-containing protein [Desulfovibrionaceae bacterium]|nr:prenyltransferase/squalene oxidase repeat-containing protein [Desulfovibrionaceae bacterium]